MIEEHEKIIRSMQLFTAIYTARIQQINKEIKFRDLLSNINIIFGLLAIVNGGLYFFWDFYRNNHNMIFFNGIICGCLFMQMYVRYKFSKHFPQK